MRVPGRWPDALRMGQLKEQVGSVRWQCATAWSRAWQSTLPAWDQWSACSMTEKLTGAEPDSTFRFMTERSASTPSWRP